MIPSTFIKTFFSLLLEQECTAVMSPHKNMLHMYSNHPSYMNTYIFTIQKSLPTLRYFRISADRSVWLSVRTYIPAFPNKLFFLSSPPPPPLLTEDPIDDRRLSTLVRSLFLLPPLSSLWLQISSIADNSSSSRRKKSS